MHNMSTRLAIDVRGNDCKGDSAVSRLPLQLCASLMMHDLSSDMVVPHSIPGAAPCLHGASQLFSMHCCHCRRKTLVSRSMRDWCGALAANWRSINQVHSSLPRFILVHPHVSMIRIMA